MEIKNRKSILAAAQIILDSKYTIALIGAGLSVGSGIPTFRGTGGLWTKLGEPPSNGYEKFLENPIAWWDQNLNSQIDPERTNFRNAIEKAQPNTGHFSLVELENLGILKHQITQNIDNLHYMAGSNKVTEIHGNRNKLRCTACESRWDSEEFDKISPCWKDILPPKCHICSGIIKPDTVMFGEPIPMSVLDKCVNETNLADCILVIGTSATVYPAASFPQEILSSGGNVIEINPEETALSECATSSIKGPTENSLPKLLQEIKRLIADDGI